MTDFARTRAQFHLPDGVVDLDGNLLARWPIAARERVTRMLEQEAVRFA